MNASLVWFIISGNFLEGLSLSLKAARKHQVPRRGLLLRVSGPLFWEITLSLYDNDGISSTVTHSVQTPKKGGNELNNEMLTYHESLSHHKPFHLEMLVIMLGDFLPTLSEFGGLFL